MLGLIFLFLKSYINKLELSPAWESYLKTLAKWSIFWFHHNQKENISHPAHTSWNNYIYHFTFHRCIFNFVVVSTWSNYFHNSKGIFNLKKKYLKMHFYEEHFLSTIPRKSRFLLISIPWVFLTREVQNRSTWTKIEKFSNSTKIIVTFFRSDYWFQH